MRFRDAAVRANQTPIVDAYTMAVVGMCQLLPFDDSRRDSVNTLRRILSVAPGTALPTRRTVKIGDEIYIAGIAHPDYHHGEPIRIKHSVHLADETAVLRNAGELCIGATGRALYCARSFIKNLAYEQQGSLLVPEYYIYTSAHEPIAQHLFFTIGDEHFFVRQYSVGETGMKLATCEQLEPGAVTNVTVNSGTYNRTTESWTSSPLVTQGVLVRWQAMFRYAHPEAPKMGPGCRVLLMTPTVSVGSEVVIAGHRYVVRYAAPATGCTAYTLVEHGLA